MFFLKKLLQFIEEKGFRAGTDGADKRSVAIAAPAAKPAGRTVRRENGAQCFADNRRGKSAAESVRAAGGELRRAEAERFAWYFAVRDFFARSAQGKPSVSRGEVRPLPASEAPAPRAAFARGASAAQSVPAREISFGGEPAGAPRGMLGREEPCASPRSYADFSEEGKDTLIFDDEFFAGLASLRGLNVEERRRGEF